jgi:thymidylate synthase
MNNLDKTYTALLQDILDNGVTKQTRNGGTISVFGRQIRHKMSDGFPLLTTKKMPFKTIVTELLWFLRGDTNIKYLVDNNCHIWDGDAYKNYVKFFDSLRYSNPTPLSQEEFVEKIKTDDEFAKEWGELGPIYGKQWRGWGKNFKQIPNEEGDKVYHITTTGIDQIANLINDLKTNPDSRRLMVNTWNVGELDQMVLPPCHYGFQFYTRELSVKERLFFVNKSDDEYNKALSNKEQYESISLDFELALTSRMNELNVPTRAISLMWNQRSVDTFLGLPFNIASYGLLLEIIAKAVNMVPDELIGNLGDTHLYSNHIEQAKEQIGRELTDEERYNIWFTNNYETGMENYFDPNNLPDFDNEYYTPTPKRTREPYPLPNLKHMKTDVFYESLSKDISLLTHLDINDFVIEHYQSHPTIKAKLSN